RVVARVSHNTIARNEATIHQFPDESMHEADSASDTNLSVAVLRDAAGPQQTACLGILAASVKQVVDNGFAESLHNGVVLCAHATPSRRCNASAATLIRRRRLRLLMSC